MFGAIAPSKVTQQQQRDAFLACRLLLCFYMMTTAPVPCLCSREQHSSKTALEYSRLFCTASASSHFHQTSQKLQTDRIEASPASAAALLLLSSAKTVLLLAPNWLSRIIISPSLYYTTVVFLSLRHHLVNPSPGQFSAARLACPVFTFLSLLHPAPGLFSCLF